MKDLGSAFSFPFKDPNWPVKFLIGFGFMLLSVFVVGIFVLAGYFIQVTQRVMRGEHNAMPEWDDIGVKLIVGFKFCVAYLVYVLPIILIYIPFVIMTVLGQLVDPGDMGGTFAGMYMLAFGAIFVIVIPYGLLLTAVSPIITYRFARNESIAEALDVREVFRDFKRNWQNTLIVALIATGIQSFAAIGVVVFIIGVFFTIFYSYLVTSHMYGLLGRDLHHEGVAA